MVIGYYYLSLEQWTEPLYFGDLLLFVNYEWWQGSAPISCKALAHWRHAGPEKLPIPMWLPPGTTWSVLPLGGPPSWAPTSLSSFPATQILPTASVVFPNVVPSLAS